MSAASAAAPASAPALLRRGEVLARAKAVCVFVHGRGQSPEAMDEHVVKRAACEGVHWMLPRALSGTWYEARATDPLAPETKVRLDAALDAVDAALHEARSANPGAAVVLAGFSQGACVALEHALRRPGGIDGLAALTGCRVGFPTAEGALPDLGRLPVYLSCGRDDPWIPLDAFFAAAGQLARAGARLTAETFPGREHAVGDAEIGMLAAMLATTGKRAA